MKVFLLSLWCVIAAILLGPETGGAGEIGPSKPRSPVVVAQNTGETSTQGPAQEIPPGGASVEDILLQKGTITQDEWIQIRAEQEYRAADQSRRLDSIEE